jgi:hypothetical protein
MLPRVAGKNLKAAPNFRLASTFLTFGFPSVSLTQATGNAARLAASFRAPKISLKAT